VKTLLIDTPERVALSVSAAAAALPPVVRGCVHRSTAVRPASLLLPRALSVWITEWSLNVNGNYSAMEPRAYGTWAEGLFCAELALLFLGGTRIGA